MNEPLPDRWADRDFPVLRELVRLMDSEPLGRPTVDQVSAALPHLSDQDLQLAGRNLSDAGFIEITGAMGAPFLRCTRVTERALRAVGVWPSDESAADALLWFLEQKVEQATTPDERGRWVKIRDSFGSAGRDFAVEVAAAMATRTMGA